VSRSKRSFTVIALLAILSLVLVACGGGDDDSGSDTTSTSSGEPAGTLTIAAEQDAACADWISNCAASAWGAWMMLYQTMPRVFDYAKEGDVWTEVPSPAMAGMPAVSSVNGKQVVTYNISPTAVWSDNTPITSNDFKYTWEQVVNGEDTYDPTGYDRIESIDTTNPKVAVVTFAEDFASWTALFSADYGIYPSHLLEGKDRHNLMRNGYDWSGGPWIADWDKGVSVTLTPNPNWYGTKPTIERVIFRIIPNTASMFKAFEGDQVDAIYPQSEPAAIASIKGGIPGTQSVFSEETGNVEALWINNARFPFDSVAVRQAFAYSIDRDAIVEALFGDLGITKAVQTLNPPIVAKYADRQAWSMYTLDLDQVNSLMTGDGWEKNGDGVWEKDGRAAAFTIKSTAGNTRRRLTEEILQEQLREAGFRLRIQNPSADDLFGKVLPDGDYQLSLFAQTATSLNPGLCSIACSSNIPSEENEFAGQNTSRINIPALDPLLATVDQNFVQNERIAASKQADQIMAQEQVSLPLDPLPNIAMWRDELTGPISDNPILSMFWNMQEWSMAG
jgi:peptide/nickel transport system substrate-binding protein